MKTLSVEQTKQMLISVADAIIENTDYLTEVDSKIGDGDHGLGMKGGMERAKDALTALQAPCDINSLFKAVGMAMMNSMGGASGVIFGTMFSGGVKGMDSKDCLDAKILTEIMRKSLESIKERGKAQLGDKTMIDALEPATEAMEKNDSEDIFSRLDAAVSAANEGLEKTKGYVAKFGRAKSLMERAVGFQDAGATSVVIILSAMRDFTKWVAL